MILGGVILLGVLLGGMVYFHPATKYARSYFITTQIVPNVRGHVIEVPVKPNVPLKQGDVLVKLDPRPYQDKVDELVRSAGGSMFDVEKYEKNLNVLKSKLDEAKFQLESCVIRAPGDGFVTHVRVRPGQMAVPLPIASLMTFVNTDTATFIAGFHQQPMQNIKVGNEVEILFVGIPGRIFKGHVEHVLTVLAEGLIPAIIRIDDDLSDYFIPMGSDAEVAVYSERWHELSIIRRILLRMQSWKNFLKFH